VTGMGIIFGKNVGWGYSELIKSELEGGKNF